MSLKTDSLPWEACLYDPNPEASWDDVAYIKREVMNFQPIYTVYDASGEQLEQTTTRQEAILWAEQNDLMPLDVQ